MDGEMEGQTAKWTNEEWTDRGKEGQADERMDRWRVGEMTAGALKRLWPLPGCHPTLLMPLYGSWQVGLVSCRANSPFSLQVPGPEKTPSWGAPGMSQGPGASWAPCDASSRSRKNPQR